MSDNISEYSDMEDNLTPPEITEMAMETTIIVYILNDIKIETRSSAFDPNIYEEALDPEECERQLSITRDNLMLRLQFLDSGLRIPRSILAGNLVDLGNYHQCLGIYQEIDESIIEGKYCTISVSLDQSLTIPSFSEPELSGGIKWPEGIEWTNSPDWLEFNPTLRQVPNETVDRRRLFETFNTSIRASLAPHFASRSGGVPVIGNMEFTLAVCVPKVCTTREGLDGLVINTTAFSFQYEDITCRFKNDKPWVAGDYVAVVIFAIIGLLTLVSTSYDLHCILIQKRESKSISTIGRSFSVYTNARRLTTFVPQPGALECIDGIRSLAMMWVIVGHTFYTLPIVINGVDVLAWLSSVASFWIIEAPITVDTFFLLSGLLLVYTTTSKMTGMKLLKNLHFFYLNRFFRMFPLLAAAILCQISIVHRLSDGPMWQDVALQTDLCRSNWWATMLYVQNFVFPTSMCLEHTWYLAIDMQLYILSPLVLFWVLSNNKKTAWIALTATLVIYFAANIPYMLIFGSVDAAEGPDYLIYYYFNTLARASPFLIGMVFGYLLHLWRGKNLEISTPICLLLWFCALSLITLAVFATEFLAYMNWHNQAFRSMVNTFMKPAWALGLGWIIFACVHGYGGIVNWILCLPLWKLPSRISYAMYLFHVSIMYILSGSVTAPIYFSVSSTLHKFVSQFAITFVVAFFFTLLIDSPFSTLLKLALGGGAKKSVKDNGVSTVARGAKGDIANESFRDTEEGNKNV